MALYTQEQYEVRRDGALGSSASMQLLRVLKSRRFIATMVGPHRKDDPDPDVCKRSHGHGMAFAFSSFPLVIVSGPRFALCRLPSELLQGIAQGFDTAQAAMGFRVHAALKQHRRSSPQRLQAAGILVTAAIITDFCQKSWCQSVASTWQAGKDLMILMSQKNAEWQTSHE